MRTLETNRLYRDLQLISIYFAGMFFNASFSQLNYIHKHKQIKGTCKVISSANCQSQFCLSNRPLCCFKKDSVLQNQPINTPHYLLHSCTRSFITTLILHDSSQLKPVLNDTPAAAV